MKKKRILSWLMTAAMVLSLVPATALAAEEDETGGSDSNTQPEYVLMNIPYNDFYQAELKGNNVEVDAVSSATKAKPRTGSLVGGSYHVKSDGSDITGITFPVKVGEGVDLSQYTKVTDTDSVDITVTNRGNTTTTTYSGKNALFENKSYAYYVLNEAPAYYKELTVDEGKLSFGKVVGTPTSSEASVTLSTNSDYGDYQIDIGGNFAVTANDTVYAVILSTENGSSYGLRHLENIWRGTSLAFSTGFTAQVHGSQTAPDHYKAIMGQTINKITYYTDQGIYKIDDLSLYVPIKFEGSVTIKDAAVGSKSTSITVTGLPDDYMPAYTIEGQNEGTIQVSDETLTGIENLTFGKYTLIVSDQKNKYANLETTFTLYTEAPAQYSDTEQKLKATEGTEDDAFSAYLNAITSVSVNGTAYVASGRGAVTIINQDGTVNLEAVSNDTLVFGTSGEYEITISATGYQDLTINPSYTILHTLTMRQEIAGGSLSVTLPDDINENAIPAGTEVTLVPEANEDYTLTSIGYCTLSPGGVKGKLVEVKANEDGAYTFQMPDANILVGAAFQDEPAVIGNKIGGDKATDWTVYAAIGDAFLHPSDTETHAKVIVDSRALENETVGLIMELRQYGTGGYTVVGTETYDHDGFEKLFQDGKTSDGTVTVENMPFSLQEGKSFEAGKAVYCVVKLTRENWVDAIGDPVYRWAYTGDATVLANGAKEPEPIVWLYNLNENSHRGALVRSILNELDIKIGTISSENLNENIGYLVGWEGYESVHPAASSESFDVEYMLMGNLPETKLDGLLDGMTEHNIKVSLKSVPTAWTAGKTFAELFSIMAKEDEAFNALLDLDAMVYDAEQLTEETYGKNENWNAFQEALEAATALLASEEEPEAEEYVTTMEALREQYLLVTGKTLLTGDVELVLTQEENGTYQVSAELNGGPENATVTYRWQDNSTEKTLSSVAADQLYKVKVTITGSGGFYGELDAKLSVPGDPGVSISAGKTSITVNLTKLPTVLNTPEPITYVVQLYQGEALLKTQETDAAQSLVFDGLTSNGSYTVKVYATNVVGRGNILEKAVKTTSSSSGGSSTAATYPVTTPTSAANGKVSVSPQNAKAGAVVTITATPNSGYELKSLTVTDQNGKAITLTDNGNGTYSFTMPDGKVNVSTDFQAQQQPTPSTGFADVAAGTYYADAVQWAVEQGITNGTAPNTFSPKEACTRGQIVTFLYRDLAQ